MAVASLDLVSPPAATRTAAPAAAPVQGQTREASDPVPFAFTGSGQEYFRIWIVNVLLTIVTLGVYSAWAKVRRLQYFYRNTRVDDAIFDYHGNPKAILKGRLLAMALVLAYHVSFEISKLAALLIAVAVVAIMPWLLARSFRFKLINSSYRGLRFRFAGTAAAAYKMLSLIPILAAVAVFYAWNVAITPEDNIGLMSVVLGVALVITMLLTVPYAHFLLKRYQHDNAYFGQTPVFFDGRAGDFFKIYWRAIGFLVLGSFSAGVFAFFTGGMLRFFQGTMFGWLFTMLYGVLGAYALYLFVHPYLQSRLQNLVWNHTEIAGIRFASTASARQLLWIHASNLALVTLTLGLYQPFAAIRVMKYRIESLTLLPDSDLEEFLSDHAGDNAGALGQEAGELFDIEISL
jgi:uncharacterized membrane protein YjgN (DUF898 family)